MSTRQLRRMQAQKELQKQAPVETSENESDEHEAPARRPNLFAALGDGDEDEDEDEDDNVEEREESVHHSLDTTTCPEKKRKKKKKKNKKKQNVTAVADEDEIDKAIKELNITGHTQQSDDARGHSCLRINDLLAINTHHLRAINEMRQLFGREVIESATAEENQQDRRRPRPAQQVDLETFLREPPGAKKLPEISIRRNAFILGREHWPRQTSGGLTMCEVRKGHDETEYAYVHDPEYEAMQALFFGSVQIGDPMRMVHLLKQTPYHVSTLLQVSSVAKQDQNMALSAELCERALFTFGRVTTSSFRQDIERGRARLDFRRPENRQFWLAGFHYLRSLLRKGTYRTALEWAKLLFAMDPQDPFGMRHYLHVLAIRAHKGEWLVEFLRELEALDVHPDMVYLRQTSVLAKLQTGDERGAESSLAKGLETVPWLYCTLFQELNLDTPPAIWGTAASSSDARAFWTKLYVHQTKDLWNNPQATTLLLNVAKSSNRIDVKCLPSDDAAVDLASARLAYLEGQTSLLSLAPRNILDSQPNYEFDPLPPPEEDNVFTSEASRLPWRPTHQQLQGRTGNLMAHVNNLLARQAARAAEPAVPGMFGEEDDDDEHARAVQEADDAELQRDIEAHFNRGGEGFMRNVLRALGVEMGAANEADDEHQLRGQQPPGAWPDEEDGRHGS